MPGKSVTVPDKYKDNEAAATMWRDVFSSAWDTYAGDPDQESKAHATASAAVNKKYGMAEERRAFVEAFPDTFEGTKVRVQMFPIGHWDGHPDGPLDVTKQDLETAIKNFTTTQRALPVDFDHGLDFQDTPEGRRAAGWIKDLELADDGLYATFDATDEAAAWIKGGQYRFISPTFMYSFTNKDSGEDQGFTLLRAGLTNVPWFDGMAPCIAMNERAKGKMVEQVRRVVENAHSAIEKILLQSVPSPKETKVVVRAFELKPGDVGVLHLEEV
jgi:phage I-like protein